MIHNHNPNKLCKLFFWFVFFSLSLKSTYADIFIYENEWGQMLFSDHPLKEGGYRLVRKQSSSKQTQATLAGQSFSEQKSGNLYSRFDGDIDYAAQSFELDPALIKAVIHAESHFNPKAKSRAGAQGLMQLMPATAAIYSVQDPYDPRQNILAGSQYLKYLLEKFENIDLALAAYNAGEGNVRQYRGIPPFKETVNYVKKVKKLHASYLGTY